MPTSSHHEPGVIYDAAFCPTCVEENRVYRAGGLTLHEYFAGKALVGVLSHPCLSDDEREECNLDHPRTSAKLAWKMADAMMSEREKRNGK